MKIENLETLHLVRTQYYHVNVSPIQQYYDIKIPCTNNINFQPLIIINSIRKTKSESKYIIQHL